MMNGYGEIIMAATRCSPEEVAALEEIMRDVVFHSTLDWLTREELEEGARIARAVRDQMDRNSA
jgi:hypothetical protein